MNGLDILSFNLEQAAQNMLLSSDPQRRAFGRLLQKCGDACWKIYRVEEQGKEEPYTDAINEALGKNAKALVLAELVEQAKAIAVGLDAAIKEAEKVKP